MKQALLIFTKNLVYGEVKTRLAATAGKEVAYRVYKQLLKHTREITAPVLADKIIFYSHKIEAEDLWNNNVYNKQLQSGSSLGERMENAFAYAFENGYKQVLIIGTDCAEITSSIINEAFAQINDHDVIIGAAEDGGYYLLGMKKLHYLLFDNIKWSTETVFDDTIAACDQLNLSYYKLPKLNDIDTESDLMKSNSVFISE
jgi:rSAM/selenodomain-associated transferase 1